ATLPPWFRRKNQDETSALWNLYQMRHVLIIPAAGMSRALVAGSQAERQPPLPWEWPPHTCSWSSPRKENGNARHFEVGSALIALAGMVALRVGCGRAWADAPWN